MNECIHLAGLIIACRLKMLFIINNLIAFIIIRSGFNVESMFLRFAIRVKLTSYRVAQKLHKARRYLNTDSLLTFVGNLKCSKCFPSTLTRWLNLSGKLARTIRSHRAGRFRQCYWERLQRKPQILEVLIASWQCTTSFVFTVNSLVRRNCRPRSVDKGERMK